VRVSESAPLSPRASAHHAGNREATEWRGRRWQVGWARQVAVGAQRLLAVREGHAAPHLCPNNLDAQRSRRRRSGTYARRWEAGASGGRWSSTATRGAHGAARCYAPVPSAAALTLSSAVKQDRTPSSVPHGITEARNLLSPENVITSRACRRPFGSAFRLFGAEKEAHRARTRQTFRNGRWWWEGPPADSPSKTEWREGLPRVTSTEMEPRRARTARTHTTGRSGKVSEQERASAKAQRAARRTGEARRPQNSTRRLKNPAARPHAP